MDPTADRGIRLGLAEHLAKLLPPLLTMQRSSWEQGIAAQALLECYEAQSSPSTLSHIYGLVHDSVVRQADDGRLAVLLNGDGRSDAGAVDPACIGESIFHLLNLHRITPGLLTENDSKRFTMAVEKMLHYLLVDSPRGSLVVNGPSEIISHRTDSVQIWSDTVYMLPPFIASAAVYYSEHPNSQFDSVSLLRMALHQIVLTAEALQAPSGEWSHIYDLTNSEFKRKAFWGVGNGWVTAGIVRVFRTVSKALETVSPINPIRKAWLEDEDVIALRNHCFEILRNTINAILSHKRPDGLFHDILDDPSSFTETNLSQELSYTLYRLLDLFQNDDTRHGLGWPPLSSVTIKEWEDLAAEMHEAAVRETDTWGFVRNVCGSPHFNAPGTAAEGQAWAILMEVSKAEYEVHQLAKESGIV